MEWLQLEDEQKCPFSGLRLRMRRIFITLLMWDKLRPFRVLWLYNIIGFVGSPFGIFIRHSPNQYSTQYTRGSQTRVGVYTLGKTITHCFQYAETQPTSMVSLGFDVWPTRLVFFPIYQVRLCLPISRKNYEIYQTSPPKISGSIGKEANEFLINCQERLHNLNYLESRDFSYITYLLTDVAS